MHLLCLVSDQTMPNLLPVIDSTLGVTRVTLAVSKKMIPQADRLRKAYAKYNQRLTVGADLSIGDPNDLQTLQETFVAWVDAHAGEDLCLNVTGGTKPMAIAAQEVFRMAGKPIFYIDISTDKVTWIASEGRAPLQLSKSPSIDTAIELNGYTIQSKGELPKREWQRFAETLADNFAAWKKVLPTLNRVLGEAQDEMTNDATKYIPTHPLPPEWGDLLEELHGAGLTLSPKKLHFRGEAARNFAQGGWLEYYVYRTVREIVGNDHVAMNVTVLAKDGETKNELDVVVLHKNRLTLIECKNRKLRFYKNGTSRADDALYKLAKLTNLQGLRAKGLLITSHGVRAEDKRRAETFSLSVFDDLATLKKKLQKLFA